MLLAVDTVDVFCSVALASRGRIAASLHEELGRGHAERLVPMIAEALEQAKARPGAIDKIVLTIGPGTFAGVRVGVSAARALAFANQARILGLTSFEAIAGLALINNEWRESAALAAVMPGRGAEISAEVLRRQKGASPPWRRDQAPRTLAPDRLAAFAGEGEALAAGPGRIVAALPETGKFRRLPCWPRAAELVDIAGLFPEQRWHKTVSPFYLRPPDARPQGASPHG